MKKLNYVLLGLMALFLAGQSASAQCDLDVSFDAYKFGEAPINYENGILLEDKSVTPVGSNGWGYMKTWSFGDGKRVYDDNPAIEHVYAESGTYEVCLTVTLFPDTLCTDTYCESITIGDPYVLDTLVVDDPILIPTDTTISVINTDKEIISVDTAFVKEVLNYGDSIGFVWDVKYDVDKYCDLISYHYDVLDTGIYFIQAQINSANKLKSGGVVVSDCKGLGDNVFGIDTVITDDFIIIPEDTTYSVITTDKVINGIDTAYVIDMVYSVDTLVLIWGCKLNDGEFLYLESFHYDVTKNGQYLALAQVISPTRLKGTFVISDVINVTQLLTSVKELDSDVAVKAYPNPIVNELTVEVAEGGAVISVIDVTGQVLVSTTSDDSVIKIDVSSLSSGLYFVKVEQGTSIKTVQIVK